MWGAVAHWFGAGAMEATCQKAFSHPRLKMQHSTAPACYWSMSLDTLVPWIMLLLLVRQLLLALTLGSPLPACFSIPSLIWGLASIHQQYSNNTFLFLARSLKKASFHCSVFKLWNTSKILKSAENFMCTHIYPLYRFSITSSVPPLLGAYGGISKLESWAFKLRLPPGTHSKRRKTEGHFLEWPSWTRPPPPSKTLKCMSSHKSDALKFATVQSWEDWWSLRGSTSGCFD